MSRALTGLDVLDILDVIKNEELYTKRLQEIKEAEKALADSKFIAATVAQANKFRDEAKVIKEEAVQLKLRIEEEVELEKKKVEKELADLRVQVEIERARAREEHSKAFDLYKAQNELSKKNQAELERLKKYDSMLVEQQANYQRTFREFQNRLAQAREILGQE